MRAIGTSIGVGIALNIALGLLLAPKAARAEGCTMALVATLKLQPAGHHVLVETLLDNKPAELIFDTGAFTSVLTPAAVNRIGLPIMRGERNDGVLGVVGGIGGERNATMVTARKVELGGLRARDYNFVSADVVRPPADGLLSVDLISKFDVDLDFPEEQAVLYQPRGDCSAPAAFLAGPLFSVPLRPIGEDRRPRVTVSIGGQDVVAMIDTGADHTAIFRSAAARLGLKMQDLAADPHGTATGVGPNQVGRARHVFTPITVGDLEFRNMQVDVLDDRHGDEVEMLLGADFQRKVHLWISYSSHTLIMQYPPRASKKPGG